MRISSFHVEGFGALHDLGYEEVVGGLVVVLGPNEAGKSTLLDFLSGVLFGFPTRKAQGPVRAPARGGRHGGRITFTDELGGKWVVERHSLPDRTLQVRMPDGKLGDESLLQAALGGASRELFRAVFAVGLDELGGMESLDDDEIRELLFTASILGQRSSAAQAMKRLGEERDDLARPRQAGAIANRLARELEGVRAELLGARREMSRLGPLMCEGDALAAEVGELRGRLGAARERARELQLLTRCWPPYTRRASAERSLHGLPSATTDVALLECETIIRRLESDVSGHAERLSRLRELSGQRISILRRIERTLAELGPEWSAERALSSPDPPESVRYVRSFEQDLARLATSVASDKAILDQAQARLERLRADGLVLEASLTEGTPPSRARADRDFEVLAELRERLLELERLQAVELSRESHQAAGRRRGRGSMAYNVALLALGAIVVAAAGLALLGPEAPLAVVAWLLSLGLAAGAVAVMRNARRAGHDDSHALRPTQPLSLSPSRTAVELEELERARIGELAEELGLGMPVSRVDLERRAAALLRGSECRYKLDSATGAFDEAEVGLEGAAEQLSRTLALQAAKTKEFAEWAAANGLGACLSPASALDVLAHIGDLRRDLAAVERIEPFLDETRARLDAFVDSVEHLPRIEGSHAAGQVHPISACTGGEDAATGAFGLACNRLVMVGAALERALDDATLRDGLARELQSNEESLRDVLGAGPEAARLNAELASGEVSAWQSEAAELSQSVKALEREEESLVRRHQSVYEAIGELTTSDRIVVLEQREQALESEMDETLRRFLVLGTARQLLQRTLTRHERERQPAVVAAAAERFRRVTGGRYTGLLADPGVQGGKTIRAVSATGEEIDAAHLSRGTVEQLYLCLRLGLADSFDARSISLPMVLDDVLVNFDPDRADAMASELVDTAGQRQILFLTCHPALAESMLEASASSGVASQLVELKQLS